MGIDQKRPSPTEGDRPDGALQLQGEIKPVDEKKEKAVASQELGARRAVVVGINAYAPPNQLPSCVNDAERFAGLLRRRYDFQDVRLLCDTDASKGRVLASLRWLFEGVTQNDRLVFFYSGHGYRPVENGILQDVLVTQDGKFLSDEELAQEMKEVPAGVLTLVIDACFSGGLEKIFQTSLGGIEFGKIKRWITLDPDDVHQHLQRAEAARHLSPFGYLGTPPANIIAEHLSTESRKGLQENPFRITRLTDASSKGLLLSACLENEEATASTSQTRGLSAFTYSLVDAVGQLGPNHSSVEMIEVAGKKLRELKLTQTPMLKEPITPRNLGSASFVLLDSPRNEGNSALASEPTLEMPLSRTDLAKLVTKITTAIFALQQGEMTMQTSSSNEKSWADDVGRVASIVVPILASLQSKGVPSQGGASKDWIDDVGRVASIVVPIVASLQSKGVPSQGGAGKDWIDDVGRVASVVVPILASLQSKGVAPQGGAGKDWIDDVGRVASVVVPIVASLQSKGVPPQDGPGKDWIDDVGRVASIVVPIVASLQSKGVAPQGGAGKDWINDVGRVASIVVPIVASLQSKGTQPQGGKSWLDTISLVPSDPLRFQPFSPDDVASLVRTVAPLVASLH